MLRYSEERREALVRRLLSGKISVAALARESGVTEMTLYRWRNRVRGKDELVSKSKKQDRLSAAQKLAVVTETASLNEAELSEYCRKKGLYAEQVRGWRSQAEAAMSGTMVSGKEHRQALKAERSQREKLERELRRKEKALAETAALLTLRKKAAAIWGEAEDE
jgi:transposase-like protein